MASHPPGSLRSSSRGRCWSRCRSMSVMYTDTSSFSNIYPQINECQADFEATNPSMRFGGCFRAGILNRSGESEWRILSAGWTTQRPEPRLAPDQPARGDFKTRLAPGRSTSPQENIIDSQRRSQADLSRDKRGQKTGVLNPTKHMAGSPRSGRIKRCAFRNTPKNTTGIA
jgi:hypothetical protein